MLILIRKETESLWNLKTLFSPYFVQTISTGNRCPHKEFFAESFEGALQEERLVLENKMDVRHLSTVFMYRKGIEAISVFGIVCGRSCCATAERFMFVLGYVVMSIR